MALINDIIKKYEIQGRQQCSGKAKTEWAANRDDIFLKVKPRGDLVGPDAGVGLGKGNLWKAQKVGLFEPAEIIEEDEIQAQKEAEMVPEEHRATILEQLESLQKENADIKERLAKLEGTMAVPVGTNQVSYA